MNKRDLYKKYVETFGVKLTLLDALNFLGELGIAISSRFVTNLCESPPLYFDNEFHNAFAKAHIALDLIISMMGEGEKEIFLRQKHYQLNNMEMAIRNKEKENETGSQ